MKTQQSNKKKSEVYSISGFKDTLASPVFYPVIVVSMLLGITSIFGFVQNPLKLKSIVNVIHKKVAETNVVSDSLANGNAYYLTQGLKSNQDQNSGLNSDQTIQAFELFSGVDETPAKKMALDGDFERIAFNYDITSESFWTDLDSSKLETAAEEMQRKQKEATTFGAPLRIDYQQNLPADFEVKDDSIYALNSINSI